MCHKFMFALFFLFLFYRPADHRHLHSFPTRRSSDLFERLEQRGLLAADVRAGAAMDRELERVLASRHALPEVAALVRSEEHTSELQSHVNLVCRLLLEKKKTNRLHTRVSIMRHTSPP